MKRFFLFFTVATLLFSFFGIASPALADTDIELARATKAEEALLPLPNRLFRILFTPRYFIGHEEHFYDDPFLQWAGVSGTVVTGIVFILIALALIYFIQKRKELMYSKIFWLFASFIILSGISQIMRGIIYFYPLYWLEAILLWVIAILSFITFGLFVKVLPAAIRLKTPSELKQINTKLEEEIERGKLAEDQRKQSEYDLQKKNQSLYEKIRELEKKKEEIERINEIMVNRELKMTELKKKIEELEETLSKKRK